VLDMMWTHDRDRSGRLSRTETDTLFRDHFSKHYYNYERVVDEYLLQVLSICNQWVPILDVPPLTLFNTISQGKELSLRNLMLLFYAVFCKASDSNLLGFYLKEFRPPQRFSETDECRDQIKKLFQDIDRNSDGNITSSEMNEALEKDGFPAALKTALKSLFESEPMEVTMDSFFNALERLSCVRGELVQWTRGLLLEEYLARLLDPGDLLDGLRGLKMKKKEELVPYVQQIVKRFSRVLSFVLLKELKRLLSSGTVTSAVTHINSKFVLDGAFSGRFASLDDFYAGPETVIGTPNPNIIEGMEVEHCQRKNSNRMFMTSNYKIETTPQKEWEFVVKPCDNGDYPHCPIQKEKWRDGNTWAGDYGRDIRHLEEIMKCAEVTKAGLLKGEVIGLRLYTGQLSISFDIRYR
jgi:hypothetical protein